MAPSSRHGSLPLPASLLLIEDDTTVGHILRVLLSSARYSVHWARDGQEAMAAIGTIPPPDIVLLDLMLPFTDGFEVLARLRTQSGWGDIPTLVLSGRSSEADILRTFSVGAHDFVRKPFNPRELLARLNRLLRVHRPCPTDRLCTSTSDLT